jgi:peroxiredoxin
MNPGETAPNVSFHYPDGRTGHLAELSGKKLLLVFLRHIG